MHDLRKLGAVSGLRGPLALVGLVKRHVLAVVLALVEAESLLGESKLPLVEPVCAIGVGLLLGVLLLAIPEVPGVAGLCLLVLLDAVGELLLSQGLLFLLAASGHAREVGLHHGQAKIDDRVHGHRLSLPVEGLTEKVHVFLVLRVLLLRRTQSRQTRSERGEQ